MLFKSSHIVGTAYICDRPYNIFDPPLHTRDYPKSIFGIFYDFSSFFRFSVLFMNMQMSFLCIILDHVKKCLYLSFNLKPSLVFYDKKHSRYN